MEKVAQLLGTLKADSKLAEKIFSQETPEAVQAILKEKGFEFSVEEILQSKEAVTKALQKEGELSDDALEKVAGGSGDISVDLSGW